MSEEPNDGISDLPMRTGNVGPGKPDPPPCDNHHEVQHRDRRPPWCNACGWRHEVPAKPAAKIGDPR